MKKYFYILMGIAALMAAVSCNKEQDGLIDDENPGNPEPEVTLVVPDNVPTTLKASYVDTKTDYDADAKFSWTTGGDGDVVYLIFYKPADNSQGWVPYRATSEEADGTAIFTIEDGDYSSLSTYTNSGVAVYGGKAGGMHVARPYSFGTESYSLFEPGGEHTASYDPFLTLQQELTGAASEVVLLGTGVGTTDASGTYSSYQFYTACAILKVTITDIPAEAKELRLCTSDKVNWPLNGDFAIPYIKDHSQNLELEHDSYRQYKYSGNYYDSSSDYIYAAVSGSSTQTFYFNVPTGTYPTGTLSLKLVDNDNNELLTKSINQAVTFNRNDMMYVTFANEWTLLGTGKFIDNLMWGVMHFADYTSDEVGFVDVKIYQKVSDNKTYRIANPYGAASSYLSNLGLSQDAVHSDYFTFTIADDGSVAFEDCTTGYLVSGKNYIAKKTPDGYTDQDYLLRGTNTDPEVVKLGPDYYDGAERQISRNGSHQTVKIIFPKAVATSTATISVSGNPYFDSGLSYSSDAHHINIYVSTKSPFQYFAESRFDGYTNSTAPVTKTTNVSGSGTKTKGNLGVTSAYFPNSSVLYAYWYSYDESGTVLMEGCRRFYYLVSTEEENFSMQFKAPTASECTAAGSSKTPEYTYSAPCSEPSAYTITLAPSDNLIKGNIMATEFAGYKGKAYGYYNPNATYPIILYCDEPFCTIGGTQVYLRETYTNIGVGENQDPRGLCKLKLNGTYYGGVNNSLADWGSYLGFYTGSSWVMKVTPFYSLSFGTKIDLSTKTVEPLSTQAGDGSLAGLYDGRPATYWHSQYSGTPEHDAKYGVYIDIDLGDGNAVTNFQLRCCLRAANAVNDHIDHVKVYATNDTNDWGDALAELDDIYTTYGPGYWTPFLKCTAASASRYIRLSILENNGSNGSRDLTTAGWSHMAELQLYSLD